MIHAIASGICVSDKQLFHRTVRRERPQERSRFGLQLTLTLCPFDMTSAIWGLLKAAHNGNFPSPVFPNSDVHLQPVYLLPPSPCFTPWKVCAQKRCFFLFLLIQTAFSSSLCNISQYSCAHLSLAIVQPSGTRTAALKTRGRSKKLQF